MTHTPTLVSADHPLQGLYEFLLREFREENPLKGETVTGDIRPHFNALCNYMAADETKNPTPSSADVIEGMRWRPIADAPRDGTAFLAYFDGKPYITYWDDERFANKPRPHFSPRGNIFGRVRARNNQPSLWLAIPALPDSKPDNQGGA